MDFMAQLMRTPRNKPPLSSRKPRPTIYPLVNHSLLLKMAIEIVDLPVKNGGFP